MLVNSLLFCNLCNVPVSKVAQYLVIAAHQKSYGQRKHRKNNNAYFITGVRTNVVVSAAVEDLTSRQEN